MKITFSARHFEATEKLRQFASDEIRVLKKYFDGVLNAEVILDEHATQKEAEIRVTMLGKTLTAKVAGDDFYKIIPKAVEKVEVQVKSTKAKALGR